MNSKPLVSVIVPTKNSIKTVEICFQSIKNQTYPRIEIIVVDNYSEDGTKEIARKYTEKIYDKGPERCTQRNFGAKQSKGEYLFFIDSDMELTLGVIKECVTTVLEKSSDVLVIPEISIGEGFWARCKALERSCYIGDETMEAARFFKREIFFKVKGYDENLIAAEDWDLSQRVKKAGFSFARINSLIKHHEGRRSLIGTIRKKYTYGKTINRYIEKHREESKRQFILVRPAFLRNYKRLLKSPITTIGLIIMKICEFGAGAWGMIFNKCLSGIKAK